MAFVKKIWVNVPDPTNMPEIPEGQESILALDADNLNRIEEGIAESVQEAKDAKIHADNNIMYIKENVTEPGTKTITIVIFFNIVFIIKTK